MNIEFGASLVYSVLRKNTFIVLRAMGVRIVILFFAAR